MASTMTHYESNPISVDFARNGEIQLVFITLRYDTLEAFNVDSKAEYTALSSTRSQKLKQTTPVPL